jgi:hypothetical protein
MAISMAISMAILASMTIANSMAIATFFLLKNMNFNLLKVSKKRRLYRL